MSEATGRGEGETGVDGKVIWVVHRAGGEVARHRHAQSVRGALAGDINPKTHAQINFLPTASSRATAPRGRAITAPRMGPQLLISSRQRR
jgi:hypothetical protein